MKVIKNDIKFNVEYESICKDLGYRSQTKFIKVTNQGTIGFTCGTPDEIYRLYKAVKDTGYKHSGKLTKAVKHLI